MSWCDCDRRPPALLEPYDLDATIHRLAVRWKARRSGCRVRYGWRSRARYWDVRSSSWSASRELCTRWRGHRIPTCRPSGVRRMCESMAEQLAAFTRWILLACSWIRSTTAQTISAARSIIGPGRCKGSSADRCPPSSAWYRRLKRQSTRALSENRSCPRRCQARQLRVRRRRSQRGVRLGADHDR